MSHSSLAWWQLVSPYLDEALGVPAEERASWLAALREQKPEIAEHLQALLDEHESLSAGQFLAHAPEMPLQHALAGQAVGPYTLREPLGEGGMAVVWLAERTDGQFQRRVAIKFSSVAVMGRAGAERFRQEGRILGKISHPHIAEMMDAGISSAGQPYLVLEYVKGSPIDQYCNQRALPVRDRIRLFNDVLAAVAHAHTNLIIHRDIKPSNVLVRDDGEVKLLDFGIAKLLGGEVSGTTELTREAGSALTPLCAAPEQLTGKAITTATDVYALGLLLYLLLTGRHPVGESTGSSAELMKAIIDKDPPKLPQALVQTFPTIRRGSKPTLHGLLRFWVPL